MPKRAAVSEYQPQLLDLSPIVEVHHGRQATIQERFEAFHFQNRHVYEALRTLALDMQRRGVQRYGMKGLFEILRWQWAIQTQGEEYRLNNNFTALYARALMNNVPELRDFFETRRCPSAPAQETQAE